MFPRVVFDARSARELAVLALLVVVSAFALRAWRRSRAPLTLFYVYFTALLAALLAAHAALRLPRFELSTYAIMLVTGAFLAWTMLVRRLPQAGLSQTGTWAIIAGCLVLGVLGGRVVEIVASHITGAPIADEGSRIAGIGLFGAFAFDATYVALLLRWAFPHVSALAVLDAGAGPALVNVGVARIGCLLAGCCHGAPTTSVLAFPITWFDAACPAAAASLGASRIWPTQPVEAALVLVLAAVCSHLWTRRGRFALEPGAVIGVAAIGYGTIRFALEFFRGDSVRLRFGFTTWQWCALALIIAGILASRRRTT